jgi:hypothetical protein
VPYKSAVLGVVHEERSASRVTQLHQPAQVQTEQAFKGLLRVMPYLSLNYTHGLPGLQERGL